ncbi:MAG: hypothetical protein AAF497_03575 [Planctomycetota bacterium]
MFRIATVILLAITTTCMAQTTHTPTQAIPTQSFQQYPSYQQPAPAYTTPSQQQPAIQNPTYNQPINNSVVQQPYTQQFNNQQFNSQQFSSGQAIQQQPVVTQPQSQTYSTNNTFNQPYSTSTPMPSEHVVISGTGGGCNSGASAINSYSVPQYQRSYSSGYRTQPTYSRSYYQPRSNNFRRWFGR